MNVTYQANRKFLFHFHPINYFSKSKVLNFISLEQNHPQLIKEKKSYVWLYHCKASHTSILKWDIHIRCSTVEYNPVFSTVYTEHTVCPCGAPLVLLLVWYNAGEMSMGDESIKVTMNTFILQTKLK